MKKLNVLCLALVASVGTLFAYDVQIGDLYYNLDTAKGTATVTYQNLWSNDNYSSLTNIVIPSSIAYNSVTYIVTSIGDSAFYYCYLLTSVNIPNSVTSIGDNAFYSCYMLNSIEIPDSVISIGDYAFAGCSGLISFTIPNNVTNIGLKAFFGCSSLTSVTIPDSVITIGNDAFKGCTSLPVENNIRYADTYLIGLAVIDNAQTYVIKEGTKWIGNGAFKNNIKLTSLTLPNSVICIGDDAFNGCSGLTSIEIPNSVTSIGYGAFAGCSGLTSIEIPNSVTSIGYGAFSSCSAITNVIIPNSVTVIGDYAFDFCYALTSVTIGSSVTSIGNDAFNACSNLTSVTLNSNAIVSKTYLSYLNVGSIFGTQVTEYIIGDEVTIIGESAFYGCSNLTSVIIPNSVTTIGVNAFNGCSGLTSIKIPDSVTSIEAQAFCNCTGLKSITCEAIMPPTCDGEYVFYNVNKSIPLYVPGKSIQDYKDADVWKEFFVILPIPGTEDIETPSANFDGYKKVIKDGQILILRADRTYTLTGVEVK